MQGKEIIHILKGGAGTPESKVVINIKGFHGYFLRPLIVRSDLLKDADVTYLTELRNRYPKSFLTEFIATQKRTAKWLSEIVYTDDTRILFMLESMSGERIGYMGVAYINWDNSYAEADAIVSGGRIEKGLMSSALQTLLLWAKSKLGIKTIGVRVLSDNPALAFYQKLGFEEIKRVPLRSVISGEDVSWLEDELLEVAERYLVYHLWDKS